MDSQFVINVCREIKAARKNSSIRRLLDELLCKHLGWDNYAYVAQFPGRFSFLGAQALMVSNYPIVWMFNYLRKGFYKNDPLANHCQNNNVALVWTTDPKDWANPSSVVLEIVAMARKEGWSGGVAIPIPAIPCRGTFAVLTRKPMSDVQDKIDTIQLIGPAIGVHIHDALYEIALKKTISPFNQKIFYLNDLERDILQCTADGMSGKQVANELGISVKAVEHQIEKVRERFNMPNRAKLLVTLYALGLIRNRGDWAHGSIINAKGFEDRLEKICTHERNKQVDELNDYLYDDVSPSEGGGKSN